MRVPFARTRRARCIRIPIIVAASVLSLAANQEQAPQNLTPPHPLPGNPQPAYPAMALEQAIEGDVEFSARVTEQGLVESVDIVAVPLKERGFEESVIEAVRNWRFDPARLGTLPNPGVYEGKVSFALAGDLPMSFGRMYGRPSRLVWQELLKVLQEERIKTAKLDQKSQVAITRRVRLGDERLDEMPVPDFPRGAIYPENARVSRNHGFVTLRALLLEDGAVTRPVLTGPEPPHPEFAAAAKGAVSPWRFQAGRIDGCRLTGPMDASVTFSIR